MIVILIWDHISCEILDIFVWWYNTRVFFWVLQVTLQWSDVILWTNQTVLRPLIVSFTDDYSSKISLFKYILWKYQYTAAIVIAITLISRYLVKNIMIFDFVAHSKHLSSVSLEQLNAKILQYFNITQCCVIVPVIVSWISSRVSYHFLHKIRNLDVKIGLFI